MLRSFHRFGIALIQLFSSNKYNQWEFTWTRAWPAGVKIWILTENLPGLVRDQLAWKFGYWRRIYLDLCVTSGRGNLDTDGEFTWTRAWPAGVEIWILTENLPGLVRNQLAWKFGYWRLYFHVTVPKSNGQSNSWFL